MTRSANIRPMFQMIAGTLLAGTLLGGCATSAGPRPDRAAASASQALAQGKVEKAIPLAEAAVLGAPREAGYRTMLAGAYLKAGRFQSAAHAYGEARELGDSSPRTALSLALSQIASGNSADALVVLQQSRALIPAGDLGLAMALAGETGRGVEILSDEVRSGNNTPKIRQNLAFAYALDGRWREARVMMSQDVAPDQLDARIGEWAMMAKPESHQQRVASLLGVPVVADAGYPAQLALVNHPEMAEAIADVAAPAQAIAQLEELPPAAAAPVPMEIAVELPPIVVASVDPVAELPPIAAPRLAAEMVDGLSEIALPPSATPIAPTAESNVTLAVATAALAESPESADFVSVPMVQAIPAAGTASVGIRRSPSYRVAGDYRDMAQAAPPVLPTADALAELPPVEPARLTGEMVDGVAEIALPPSAAEPASDVAVAAASPVALDVVPTALADDAATANFVSMPVIQAVPVTTASVGQRRSPTNRVAANQRAAQPAPAARPAPRASATVAPGTHMVQLGAYSSRDAARSAWNQAVARTPALSGYRMATSSVTVNGKTLFRVAAAGFDGTRTASAMCGTIRARGATCLVLAAPREAAPARLAGRR